MSPEYSATSPPDSMRNSDTGIRSPREPERVTNRAPSSGSKAGFATGWRSSASFLPKVRLNGALRSSPLLSTTSTGPTCFNSGTTATTRLAPRATIGAGMSLKRTAHTVGSVVSNPVQSITTSPPAIQRLARSRYWHALFISVASTSFERRTAPSVRNSGWSKASYDTTPQKACLTHLAQDHSGESGGSTTCFQATSLCIIRFHRLRGTEASHTAS